MAIESGKLLLSMLQYLQTKKSKILSRNFDRYLSSIELEISSKIMKSAQNLFNMKSMDSKYLALDILYVCLEMD